jgi:diguanylate cyclase (GGDEF)-like protein/PAS domain S-box-containing protein
LIYWGDRGRSDVRAEDDEQVRILVIEDDARFAISLEALLTASGWQTDIRHSGQEGLARLAEVPCDLVLVDIGLPDISGHEVVRGIREKRERLPVIVVSGETQIEAAIEALRLGAADYVRKPIEPEFLLHSIRRVLKQNWLEREYKSFQHLISQSERMHRFLVDNSPDIIFTLNEAGCINFINDRVQERLGIPRQELLGRHFSDLVYQDDRDRVRYVLKERRTHDQPAQTLEMRLASALDGKGYRHFQTMIVPIAHAACAAMQMVDGGNLDEACCYGVARDITEQREAEAWASFQANHDALTGLPNRNLFRDRVGLAITQAQRNQERFAVLFLNLDRFNAINDMHGHAKADELLIEVAERIQRCLRGADTLARFAADEFLLLNSQIQNEGDVVAVIDRIRQELATPFEVNDRLVSVSASIGIALYPEHGDTPEALIRHANIALYHGRLSGGSHHAFFAEEMRACADYKLQIEDELKQAVEAGELELFFQPQVDTRSRRIRGVEALLRWNHPRRGLLAPGEFISVAEETGLIVPITRWVVAEVCRLLNHWDQRGVAPPRVSINLSPRCLEMNEFVHCFSGFLDLYEVDPGRIEVEITENMFIRDPAAVVSRLNALADRGVKIAIDDFGTQYSSLGYLQKFPIHTLKIDKSFVWDIDREYRHLTIIKAIISIGHGLGLNLIAEGVETEEQMRFLASHGCNEIQGYLISKPLPRALLENLLARDGDRPDLPN